MSTNNGAKKIHFTVYYRYIILKYQSTDELLKWWIKGDV